MHADVRELVFIFSVNFVCDVTDSFVPVLSASDWLLCMFISRCDPGFCAIIFVLPVYELNALPLSLTVIKTFSFASSCLSAIFQFCDIFHNIKIPFFVVSLRKF